VKVNGGRLRVASALIAGRSGRFYTKTRICFPISSAGDAKTMFHTTRREFLKTATVATAGAGLATLAGSRLLAAETGEPLYKISVAEYSLHRMLERGELDPLDYAPFCKKTFGVDAVEYWNGPFADKAKDAAYMGEMHKKAVDAGVKELLIMIDGEGNLGAPDDARRQQAVENHYKWVEAAKKMGCHSIRVNARSEGSREEQQKLAADGLRRLSEFAATHNINVLVENHGGLSSDGSWLAAVMKEVDLPNCGTLPDFGNFRVGRDEEYDRYKGVEELMPFAKAVSAKSHDFDEEGNEIHTDYFRMMKIVVDAGYRGYVGIEYEGSKVPEVEGTKLTKQLLERVRDKLSA
jgi:sugar phosphate isomerase/epimerase